MSPSASAAPPTTGERVLGHPAGGVVAEAERILVVAALQRVRGRLDESDAALRAYAARIDG